MSCDDVVTIHPWGKTPGSSCGGFKKVLITVVILLIVFFVIRHLREQNILHNNNQITANNTNSIQKGEREIYVDGDTLYVYGTPIKKPEELYVIEQDGKSVVFGEKNAEQVKLAVGKILSPNGKCGDYFYDREKGVINQKLTYVTDARERKKVIHFSCMIGDVVDNLKLPLLSFQKPYYSSKHHSDEFALGIHSQLLTKHWNDMGYDREPYEVASILNTLAGYLNKYHKLIIVNGQQLLHSGPNAGGLSPVSGISMKGNKIYSANMYRLLKNFNDFLNSCEGDYVSRYIKTLEVKKPDLEQMKDDLSCAGEISFENTLFLMF